MTQPIPRKRFGQHFLIDQSVIERIIMAIQPNHHDHFVEIGPGLGALTLPILKSVSELSAIELDKDLIPYLKNKSNDAHLGKLIIHESDVLAINFHALKQDTRLLRLFGNLPYNISTPLIFHLLDQADCIADMVFMLQKEVADRIAAKAGSADYGRLSVMVQYACHVELLFDVPPQAFNPPPKVESSIIRLVPHRNLPYVAKNKALFAELVKAAFGQRRKTLRNSLKNRIDDNAWSHINLSPTLRAENVSVSEFVAMANWLADARS